MQNLHTHCAFCDGTGTPEEFVTAAVAKGLESIGFSSHAPVPFKTDWTMPPASLPAYLLEIKRLKTHYQDHITVFCGLEIDYLPGEQAPDSARFTGLGLDYTIGAVHFIGRDGTGTAWSIDGTNEEFEQARQRLFGGNTQALVREYYARIKDLVNNHPPDILGHLDVIKKNNRDGRYFSETETWYRQAVEETLTAMARHDLIMEVNAGGIIRKRSGSLYPGEWVLERCLAHGIRVTPASDAHAPNQLTAHFAETAKILRRTGFKELALLTPDGWRSSRL